MQTITVTIPPISDYPKLGDAHEVFRQKADTAWRDLSNMVPQINDWSAQVNQVGEQFYGWLTTTQIAAGAANAARSEAVSAKNDAIDAKNVALETKEWIEGYVIPTEATYSPVTIEAKIRRAKVLSMTKSI